MGVCDHGAYREPCPPLPVGDGPLELRLAVQGERAQFSVRQERQEGRDAWQPAGPELDTSPLSDENATQGDPDTGHFRTWGFTGAFLGLCAQDLTGAGAPADFDWTEYRADTLPGAAAR
ncbi:hypothetical protein [Streptomyces sp. NBC_00726]|uniref:beta-xylosidase family glycoside hydrolase n=1 Tax=Streptomyces sp. NBC_00726 TaxID=2903674 RepID=UPI003865A415